MGKCLYTLHMGVVGRLRVAALFAASSVFACAGQAESAGEVAPSPLQRAIVQAVLSALPAGQQKGLPQGATYDQYILRMDLNQRVAAAGRLAPLESRFPAPEQLQELGEAYLKLGAFAEATRLGGDIQKKFPNSAVGFMLTSKSQAEGGDLDGAKASAMQGVQADPSNASAMTYYKLLREGRNPTLRVGSVMTPAAGGGNFQPDPSLGTNGAQTVNRALSELRKSKNGKRIILAIVPDSNGTVTLEQLQQHGVVVQGDYSDRVKEFGKVEKVKRPDGSTVYVIRLNKEVLTEGNDPRTVAAAMGGKLDTVQEMKEHPQEEIPVTLLDWRDRTAQAYILFDLGVVPNATSFSSPFTQSVLFNERVLQGGLQQTPLNAANGETYGADNDRIFQLVAISEISFRLTPVDLLSQVSRQKNLGQDIADRKLPGFETRQRQFSLDLKADYPAQ